MRASSFCRRQSRVSRESGERTGARAITRPPVPTDSERWAPPGTDCKIHTQLLTHARAPYALRAARVPQSALRQRSTFRTRVGHGEPN